LIINQSINQLIGDVLMARRKEHGPSIGGFATAFYEEDRKVFEKMEDLRAKDKLGKGEFVKLALAEYVQRHHPGNPTIPLDHWQRGQGLSIAAKEKLRMHEQLPPKTQRFKCEYCGGNGCDFCGGKGYYYVRMK
jgi:hypothetical protein